MENADFNSLHRAWGSDFTSSLMFPVSRRLCPCCLKSSSKEVGFLVFHFMLRDGTFGCAVRPRFSFNWFCFVSRPSYLFDEVAHDQENERGSVLTSILSTMVIFVSSVIWNSQTCFRRCPRDVISLFRPVRRFPCAT